MSDIAERAEQREATDRKLVIDSITKRTKEEPETDGEGYRRCLDCWMVVPVERIVAVDAVRCVGCQGELEKFEKGYV